ncbi:germ cell nuclear acidic protein-like isoform X6 [Periplaneta americana]|uniref:germ cell nuclear acidic protein-like isoform X6 n=1 Tax=Periplaneta americana TaxID=6978 RepID=UPI0037E916FB
MALEFSLLTFSPSRVENAKISIARKKLSKLSSKKTRVKACAKTTKEDLTSANVINVEGNVSKSEFTLDDFYDVQCDNHNAKARVGKGKENRTDSFNAYEVTDTFGHQRTSYIKNNRNSSGKCLSSRFRENRSSWNERSSESELDKENSRKSDVMNCYASIEGKTNDLSRRELSYIACSQNAEHSVIAVSESNYSSLSNLGLREPTEGNGDWKENDDVLVVSDIDSDMTADSAPRKEIKHRLHSESIKSERDLQDVRCTIILDSSCSENDVLEASCRTPHVLYPNLRSSSFTKLKCRTPDSTQKKVGNIKCVPRSHSSLLNHTKYKDIDNWVSQIHISNKNGNKNGDKKGEASYRENAKDFKNSKINSTCINSSAEDVLDQLYGSTWRQVNEFSNKDATEPCKRRKKEKELNSSGNSHSINRKKKNVNDHPGGICRKLSFSSVSTSTSVEDNSRPNNEILVKTIEKKSDDYKKKKATKRKRKVVLSPVKRIKEAPKIVKRTRLKSRLSSEANSSHCSPVLSFLASLSGEKLNGQCHPEALYYKNNFKKKKEELCSTLFKLYNNEVFHNKLPHDMSLTWNVRMNRTAGFCYNRWTITSPGTKIRSSRIVLSAKVCDTSDRLRDTLIHEMCHAAAWIMDGMKDGHGPCWKAWARRATLIFPELPPIKRCHEYNIQTKFTYRCTSCGYSIGRHSKSLDVAVKRCGHCFGVFELLVNTRRKSGTILQTLPKKRSPVGFARFVKENYSSVKQLRRDLKHADVMRLLGQQFSSMKIGAEVKKQQT